MFRFLVRSPYVTFLMLIFSGTFAFSQTQNSAGTPSVEKKVLFSTVEGVKENSAALSGEKGIPSVERSEVALTDVILPSNYVTLKDSYKGLGEKKLILIQDAHCNPEAQLNIFKTIRHCVDQYNVDLLCIEGSVGEIPLTSFRNDPDKERMLAILFFFLTKGRVTGGELACVYSEREITLFGIEEEDMYNKNFEAFKKTMPLRSQFYSGIEQLETSFSSVRDKVYGTNRPLKNFHKRVQEYEDREIKFGDYGLYLVDMLGRLNINKAQYPNLVLFGKVSYYENKIDFKAVDAERNSCTEALVSVCNDKYLTQIDIKSKYYVDREITTGSFYTFLVGLARNHDINLSAYPNLLAYQIYMSAFESINQDLVLKEMLLSEVKIAQTLCKNAEQRQLDQAERALRKLKSFYKLEMSQHDLDFFNDNRDSFSVVRMVSFLRITAANYGVDIDLNPNILKLDTYYPDLLEFYRYARLRDPILVDKTLEKMDEIGVNVAIQVTGGFHTEGITRILRERKISYVTCAPRIEKESDPELYIEVLLGRTSFLDYTQEFEDFYADLRSFKTEKTPKEDETDIDILEELYQSKQDTLEEA